MPKIAAVERRKATRPPTEGAPADRAEARKGGGGRSGRLKGSAFRRSAPSGWGRLTQQTIGKGYFGGKPPPETRSHAEKPERRKHDQAASGGKSGRTRQAGGARIGEICSAA